MCHLLLTGTQLLLHHLHLQLVSQKCIIYSDWFFIMTIGNKCESEPTKSAAFKITMSLLAIAIIIISILFLIIVILVCKLLQDEEKNANDENKNR